MNKRMKKKNKYKCVRCKKYSKDKYNWFCRPCGWRILKPAFVAGNARKRAHPESATWIIDSQGTGWVWLGRNEYGGWRSNLGAFSECLLEPWIIWGRRLKFKPVLEEANETTD